MPPKKTNLFSVDPDISKAKTISKEFYTNKEIFELAKEKIFANAWQYIGSAEMLNEKQNVFPFTLFENYLNEPLLLTKDKENKLHCLSNACTHRGNILAENACTAANLRCKYHGRIFSLDGKFTSMPEFKGVKNFPSKEDNLTNLPLFQWGNWIFTSLGKKQKAESIFGDMMQRMSWLPVNDFRFRPDLSQDYMLNTHWALYCENFLEGFHIPFIHAGLNEIIDFGNYKTDLYKYSNVQVAVAKDNASHFNLPESSVDFGQNISAYYFFVFPNMMFNFYPWGLSLNIIKPVGIDRTKISFITYVNDESKLNKGAGTDLHTVEMEDEEIVLNVQRGIRSRFYKHGRYSVTRETGVHHFHRLLAGAIK